MFKPKKLFKDGMSDIILEEVDKVLENNRDYIGQDRIDIIKNEYRFYMVNKEWGLANYETKHVEIPYSCYFDKDSFLYLLIHELCHVLCFIEGIYDECHGENFYKHFIELCPIEYHDFELDYIKTSSKYGVGENKYVVTENENNYLIHW